MGANKLFGYSVSEGGKATMWTLYKGCHNVSILQYSMGWGLETWFRALPTASWPPCTCPGRVGGFSAG